MPSHHIRSSHKTSQVAPAHSSSRQADEPIVESKRYLKLRALTSEKVFPTLEGLAEEKGLDVEHHDIPAQDESHSLAPSAWSGKLPEIVKKDAEFTQADTIIINEPEQVSKPENQNTESHEAELKEIFAHNDVPPPSSLENHELAPAAWQSSAIPQSVMQNEEANDHVEMPEEIPTDSHLVEQRASSSRNKKRKDRKRREAQEEEISKPSETLTSEEPIAESKANLKPQALKSEQIFPTLEGLAEEKGIEIEEHHEIPAQEESHDLAPSAWEGKLPEIVKKDIEFTQADTIIINEPVEEQQQQQNINEEIEAPKPTAASELEKKNEVEVDSVVTHVEESSSRNKKKNRKHREAQQAETKVNKSLETKFEEEQPIAIEEPIQAEPLPVEEPIAESKANLKPQALKSEQIFPTLEGLAEEKGLDTYIDDHNEIPAQEESHDPAHAAWQGKLPKIVKQKYEFTQADTIIINEFGEKHTMNEEPAAEPQRAIEANEPVIQEEIQPEAELADAGRKKKKSKKHRKSAEKAPAEPVLDEEDEAFEEDIEEQNEDSKANLKPTALTSTEIFPTLKSLAVENHLDTYLEERPWAGKLPEVVKQDAEFTKADVKFVDEPAERAAALAKKKQERKERRAALHKQKHLEKHDEVPAEDNSLAPSSWPQDVQESNNQDGEFTGESREFEDDNHEQANEEEAALPFEAYYREGNVSPQYEEAKNDEFAAHSPINQQQLASPKNIEILVKAKIEQGESLLEKLVVSAASGILGLYFSMVCGMLRLVGLRNISGRIVMGGRSVANTIVEGTPLRRLKVQGQKYRLSRSIMRMAGKVDHNVRAQIAHLPAENKNNKLSAQPFLEGSRKVNAMSPASPGAKQEQARFASFESFVVGCASSILVMYLSIVAGFLRLFGIRDLSGRLVMSFRSAAGNLIEGTPLRRVKAFGRKFGTYRMAARVARNVDREVRTQLGSLPAKKEVHFENEGHKRENSMNH